MNQIQLLSDYASDLSKETPTAAAMAAVPDIQVIRSNLTSIRYFTW